MPNLSKYVFYLDGSVQSRHTGHMLKLWRSGYHLTDDNGEREYIEPSEIIQYGKHKEATETKRDYINRVLYDKVVRAEMHKNVNGRKIF